MFPWSITKITSTPSDKVLERVKSFLYPPLELYQKPDQEGEIHKYHIDYSIDSNLSAALDDLEDGNNDSMTRETISQVLDKLLKLRQMLKAYTEIDPAAHYVIVDNDNRGKRDIVAQDLKI